MYVHHTHTHRCPTHLSLPLQLVIDEEELELIAGSSLEHQHWVENISQALKSTCKSIAQNDQSKGTIRGPIYAVRVHVQAACMHALHCTMPNIQLLQNSLEMMFAVPL